MAGDGMAGAVSAMLDSSIFASGWSAARGSADSNLPPAAEQPEAKIELSSIGVEPTLPTAGMPTPPSLSEATEEVRSTPQLGPGDQPPG